MTSKKRKDKASISMEGYESSDSGVYDIVDMAFPFKYQPDMDSTGTPTLRGGWLPDPRNFPRGGPFHAPTSLMLAVNVAPSQDISIHDDEYFMNNPERGIALIFNHENFDEPHVGQRIGTQIDRDGLSHAFTNLGFEVRCFNDLRSFEILHQLRRVAEENHKNRDCIVVAVLTHGVGPNTLYAMDATYHISQLVRPLTPGYCPSLAGKPKLFFIQADRAGASSEADSHGFGGGNTSYGDVLISHSTFEGCHSFRNMLNGSWYVQTLCAQLEAHGRTKDLVSLLTDVNRVVSTQFRSSTPNQPDTHGLIQEPCFSSSLKRKLFFR